MATPLFLRLRVKWYYYCSSTRKTLTLSGARRLICHPPPKKKKTFTWLKRTCISLETFDWEQQIPYFLNLSMLIWISLPWNSEWTQIASAHKIGFLLVQIFMSIALYIGLVGRVFANGPEAWVQSQVASYQRLLKWYLIPPCLTSSIIRNVSRVKWSNPEKGVDPFPTPKRSSYWKGSLLVALDYGRQLYFYFTL